MKKLLSFILMFALSFALFACEEPHEHEFFNGECSCGEKHDCEFVDGKCECGKFEEKEEHTHNFVDGKCECGETEEVTTPSIKDDFDCITIPEALAKAAEAGSAGTSEQYYVYGTIKEVSNFLYGAMTITDGTNDLFIYGVYSKDGQTRYDALEEKPVVGDEVVLLGILKDYNGTMEMDRGYLQAMKKVEVEIDESNYTEKKINVARDDEAGALVKLTGVVAKITYANGMIPNGFYLVDETGSIYVYGKEVASSVKEGNTITILGEKTYYVLDTEKDFAAKYNYKGACQIDKPVLLSNDKGSSDFDKSWVEESTVKAIMDTPVTENITSNIYKVNALVTKKVEPGFVNYYIDDLDGKTGSYVYTQCNGSDFGWLDEFDGKICTVYLSAINCKSTASGCVYRFVPVSVKYENFTFDLTDLQKVAKFALDYYVAEQLKDSYESDPAIELVTSVNNELLGFANAQVTYTSTNEDAVYFEEVDGKVIFHTKNPGTSTVTMTVNYNGKEASFELEVTVEEAKVFDTITVEEAVANEDGTEVIVKGVVVSSLVNQTGFYLSDSTGLIAVVGSADQINELSAGDEVVIKGIKSHKKKDGYTGAGQINIYNAEVLANYYGNHDYDTSKFITGVSFEEIYNFDVNDEHSNEVYVLEGRVRFIESGYSKQVKLESLDGSVQLTLYCSGSGQYSFVKDYVDQVGVFEFAVCNWNSKTYYAGCLISATFGDVKLINDLNLKK